LHQICVYFLSELYECETVIQWGAFQIHLPLFLHTWYHWKWCYGIAERSTEYIWLVYLVVFILSGLCLSWIQLKFSVCSAGGGVGSMYGFNICICVIIVCVNTSTCGASLCPLLWTLQFMQWTPPVQRKWPKNSPYSNISNWVSFSFHTSLLTTLNPLLLHLYLVYVSLLVMFMIFPIAQYFQFIYDIGNSQVQSRVSFLFSTMGQPWRPRELSPIFVVHTRGSFFKAPMKWVGTGLAPSSLLSKTLCEWKFLLPLRAVHNSLRWICHSLRRARQQHTVVHNNGDSDDNRVVEEENHRRG